MCRTGTPCACTIWNSSIRNERRSVRNKGFMKRSRARQTNVVRLALFTSYRPVMTCLGTAPGPLDAGYPLPFQPGYGVRVLRREAQVQDVPGPAGAAVVHELRQRSSGVPAGIEAVGMEITLLLMLIGEVQCSGRTGSSPTWSTWYQPPVYRSFSRASSLE